MRSWAAFQYWVHDNISLILFVLVVAFLGLGWLVTEALRSHHSRDQVFRLRQRLYELERDKNFSRTLEAGSVVLASRWIRVGSAATTSDGGCLLLVEGASPVQSKAMMTVRVDGLPVKRNQSMAVGQRLDVQGKSGTYNIELHGAESNQARFHISLRNRHLEA